MKSPWYEISPGATIALLLTKTFVKMDLYTIFLQGGGTLRYATGAVDVSVPGGYYWQANSIPINLSDGSGSARAHYKIGSDVDTWQFSLAPRPVGLGGVLLPDKIGNKPWTQAVRAGALDGAKIQVDRAVFASWPKGKPASITPVGVTTIFYGPTAAIDVDRSAVIITAQSLLQLLTQQTPRNVYQAGCRHALFDPGCGLLASNFKSSGACANGSTTSILRSGLTAALGSGTFSQGRVVMTSGENAGFSRAVRLWNNTGAFTLIVPLPYAVAVGDTFDAYPGCDKTLTTCTLGFANNANFGGEPYTPAPETAI